MPHYTHNTTHVHTTYTYTYYTTCTLHAVHTHSLYTHYIHNIPHAHTTYINLYTLHTVHTYTHYNTHIHTTHTKNKKEEKDTFDNIFCYLKNLLIKSLRYYCLLLFTWTICQVTFVHEFYFSNIKSKVITYFTCNNQVAKESKWRGGRFGR